MNNYVNYFPYIDVASILMFLVFYLIIRASFYNNSLKNKLLKRAFILLFLASIFNLLYLCIIKYSGVDNTKLIYSLRLIANILFLFDLGTFNEYLNSLFDLDKKYTKVLKIMCIISLIFFIVFMALTPITHLGFYIENNIIMVNFFHDIFSIAYLFYCAMMFFQLVMLRKNMITRAFYTIIHCFVIIAIIMVFEYLYNDITFFSITFVYPILVVFSLFHSNPYDLETGTLGRIAFGEYLKELYRNGKNFNVMSLLFLDEKKINILIKDLQKELAHFYEKYFINTYTFRLNDNRFVLIYEKTKNINFEKNDYKNFMDSFNSLYEKYKLDFKLLHLKSNQLLEERKRYTDYIKYLESKIKKNKLYISTSKDLALYFDNLNVLDILNDINKKGDLEDERILVYTQPIYKLKKDKFLTAEALMRLYVNNVGFIYPDQFVPIAEENNLLHFLSLIILNKTCKELKKLLKEGYEIDRISVNFSTLELRSNSFVKEVKNIIEKNKVPFDKIALEITESQIIGDYDIIIKRINELKKLGIKIYLDDFGTGYSNFERIMKLPIDVIKFDKSLLESAKINDNIKIMTKNFSKTFSKLNYEILFEGIESEKDIELCREMNFDYLQGYYYSKPIPIENLKKFLKK